MNRAEAIQAGHKRYEGNPCSICNKTERYVRNYECIACKEKNETQRRHAKLAQRGPVKKGRPKKQPLLIGGLPVPKKIKQKPKTEFDYWVHRSKHGKNRTLRKNLTDEMYLALYRTHCPLLGIELTYNYTGGNVPNNYASLDKIDPNKGYVEGNVQILSFRANTLKGDATIEELRMLVDNWTNQKI
jgi:hypothetical protein